MLNSTPQISAHVGDYILLTSGIIHSTNDDPITVKINEMTFIFKFMYDDGVSRYTGTISEPETLTLELYNHKHSLGEGVLSPYPVGTLDTNLLFFTYFVTTVDLKNKSRRFEYAFYLR